MTVSWSWAVEAYISSSWTDITRDVLSFNHDIVATHGIEGSEVSNRVAMPGALTLYLDNSEANSAGLLGYYSPDHTNARTDFDYGLPVRLKLTSGGTTKYIRFELTEIAPTAGRFKERETYCQGVDYMDKLLKYKPSGISVQEEQRPDQLIQTIFNAMETAPINTSLAVDSIELPLALHSEQNERATGMSLITKTIMSALGYGFITADATDGETFVYQSRHTRPDSSSAATLSDTMSGLRVKRSDASQYDKVICSTHPARRDTDQDTTLATLQKETRLGANKTITLKMRYRDPNGVTRISATDILDPEPNTHYRRSSIEGNNGNDLNANLTITVADGGNEAIVTLTDTGGTTGWINKLDLVGNGIYLYDPFDVTVEGANPEKVLNFDLPYIDDYYTANDFATAIYNRVSAPATDIESVSFYADANSTLMGYALSCDVGSRITLTETATGVDRDFWINKVTWRIQSDGRLFVEWLLDSGWAEANFMILDDTTAGVLDDTDYVLAF